MIFIILPSLILIALCFVFHRIPYILSSRSSGYLPTTRYHLTRPVPPPQGWTVEWAGTSLSFSTRDYNAIPRLVVIRWKRYQSRLGRFYVLGGITGVMGLFGSLGGASWAINQVWGTVWEEFAAHSAASPSSTLTTRMELGGLVETIAERSVPIGLGNALAKSTDLGLSSSGLSPLIPGITIPLSHLPTIILVLVFCQLVHELGHALSASVDGLSPSRFSLNLHYILPSMTVSFPSSAQIRLASAGAWHNLVTWAIIASLSFSRIWRPFWQNVGDYGLVIESVDFMSPLSSYLRPGELITHLDEVSLAGTDPFHADLWDAYLHTEDVWDDTRGWCVLAEQWDEAPAAPCSNNAEISFAATVQNLNLVISTRCLSAHPILDRPTVTCPCADGSICVRPSMEEKVLRIRIESDSSKRSDAVQAFGKVVLWAGDRREVMESVKVGRLSPRVFPAFCQWLVVFFNYISTISLSLYFFNLLPLSGTDGSHLLAYLFLLFSGKHSSDSDPHYATGDDLDTPLRATLNTPPHGGRARSRSTKPSGPGGGDVADVEAGQYDSDTDSVHSEISDLDHRPGASDARTGGRWKRRIRKGVEYVTVALVGSWALGWAMVALLRSS